MNKIIKAFYVLLGMISLILGFIGIILPILPTTPFLILAAFCFTKGSKKINDWFISSRIYKKYLDGYIKERAMPLKTKIYILTLASTMLCISLLIIQNKYIKIFIIFLIIIKYYYFICKIKTKK